MKDKTSGHYHKLGVQNIIKRFSTYNAASKAGVFDNKGWYKYGDDKRRLINLLDDEDYQYLVNKFDKRLLGTLNYFRPSVFQEWQQKPWDVAESLGGLEDTMYYMLSIDLDLANDYTVNDVKALEALETAARFISDDLRKVINDKFLILFSGNGIYFHLHPEFVASGETNDAACESRATELQNILGSETSRLGLKLYRYQMMRFKKQQNLLIYFSIKYPVSRSISSLELFFQPTISLKKLIQNQKARRYMMYLQFQFLLIS